MLFRVLISFLIFPFLAQADFVSAVTKLNGMKADVESHENLLKKLMNEKRRSTDPKTTRKLMAEIVERYKLYEEAVTQYRKHRARATVRYPGKRGQLMRYHPRYHFQSLDKMMKEDGVPEKLDKMARFLEVQYGKAELEIKVSRQSKGNISGDMKAYQAEIRKQQSGSDKKWNETITLER